MKDNSKIKIQDSKNKTVNSGRWSAVSIGFTALALLTAYCMLPTAYGQSGGTFQVTQSVIAGGGGSNSAGGTFSLDATIGQAVAGDTSTSETSILASGFWTVNPFAGQGFEADVAPRATGDGVVLSNDVIQVQRFQIGLDQPFQSNEQQRADSAPFVARGDDVVQSNDAVQAQRYQIGLEAPQTAAGPAARAPLGESQSLPPAANKTVTTENVSGESSETRTDNTAAVPAAPRLVHVQSTGGIIGQQVQVNILVDAMGDESAYGFTLSFNPAILTSPTTTIGSAGGSRLCNTNVAGRISCSIINFPDNNPSSSTDQIGEILPGNNQVLLRITFTIAPSAPSGVTPLTLSNVNASDDAATNLSISSQNGAVGMGPTAATVSITGRVTDATGNAISKAIVTMLSVTGESKTALTNPFGYYVFTEVQAGEAYIFSVRHKRFSFSPRVVSVDDEITDLNFTAVP